MNERELDFCFVSRKPHNKGCCAAAVGLPWEGIVKLILTGLGILVSVVASGPAGALGSDDTYVSNIR